MAKAKDYYADVEPDYNEAQDYEESDYGEEESEEYSGDNDDYYSDEAPFAEDYDQTINRQVSSKRSTRRR